MVLIIIQYYNHTTVQYLRIVSVVFNRYTYDSLTHDRGSNNKCCDHSKNVLSGRLFSTDTISYERLMWNQFFFSMGHSPISNYYAMVIHVYMHKVVTVPTAFFFVRLIIICEPGLSSRPVAMAI